MTHENDRIRIDILGGVPPHFGPRIINIVRRMAKSRGLYSYIREDRTTSQVVVEITAHDRDKEIVIRETKTVEMLHNLATQNGMTINEYLQKLVVK
jgi:hypothetical protein